MKECELTRSIKHQEDSRVGIWESSGVLEHTKSCHGQFDWLITWTFGKLKILRERKIHESLEKVSLAVKTKFDDTIKVLSRD